MSVVFSFLGTAATAQILLPVTMAGWIVWLAQIISVGMANMAIYHCLQQQAKINIKNNKQFITANELLNQVKSKENQARSPKQYFRQQYGVKAISLFITSSLGVFSLGQAILVFNLVTLISYLLTMGGGLIFSYFQMKKTELFWTDEYYNYAQQEIARKKEIKQNDNN